MPRRFGNPAIEVTLRFENPSLQAMLQYFGREAALAYNVLNTTNYWAIGLVGGLVTAVLIPGTFPTITSWSAVVIGFIFLTRFFIRSCLPYMNLWRWNLLNQAILDTLGDDARREYHSKRLDAALDLYYYQFHSPIPRRKILWDSLKLTYLWLFAVLGSLFAWGWIKLWNSPPVWGMTGVLAVALFLERSWFYRSGMFLHQPMPQVSLEVPPVTQAPTLEMRMRRLEECCEEVLRVLKRRDQQADTG